MSDEIKVVRNTADTNAPNFPARPVNSIKNQTPKIVAKMPKYVGTSARGVGRHGFCGFGAAAIFVLINVPA
jgi:hypothetical protein